MVNRTQHNTPPVSIYMCPLCFYPSEEQSLFLDMGQRGRSQHSDILACSVQQESEALRIRTEAEVNKKENVAGMTYDAKIKFSQSYASA
jgi:hypothetical protein